MIDLLVLDSSVAIVTANRTETGIARVSSRLEVAGGFVDTILGQDQSSIVLSSGGTSEFFGGIDMTGESTFLMSGGFAELVRLQDSSTATISGGAIGESGLLVMDDATALIKGGTIGQGGGSTVAGQGQAVITWTGGQIIAALFAEDSSVIRVVGSNFAVDGVPVDFGPLQATTGVLTGTLLSGASVSALFFQQSAEATGMIVLVPEPSTLMLLAGGLLALTRTGRRQR